MHGCLVITVMSIAQENRSQILNIWAQAHDIQDCQTFLWTLSTFNQFGPINQSNIPLHDFEVAQQKFHITLWCLVSALYYYNVAVSFYTWKPWHLVQYWLNANAINGLKVFYSVPVLFTDSHISWSTRCRKTTTAYPILMFCSQLYPLSAEQCKQLPKI